MSSSKWIHRGGLAAIVGGIVGILYAPFYALAYFATPDGVESLEAPWVAAWAGAVRPVLEPFLTFTGTVLGTIGGIGVYWVGSFWWGIIDFSFLAFMVPTLLLFGVGFPLFGVGTLRAKAVPRLGAWLLIVGGLPGMILLNIALGQLTLGLLLLNLAWIILGYALFSEKVTPARQPAPAS